MRKFSVKLRGQNFLVSIPDRGETKCGFYTTRFVEAADEREAEFAAVDQLRARRSLRDAVRNPADDPPRIFLEDIAELSSFDGIESLDQGLAWYPEEPSADQGAT